MATLTNNQSTSQSANPQNRIAAAQSAQNSSTSSLQYPADLPVHYAKITFVQYNRDNPNSNPTERITGNVILPIPSQLNNASSMQYAGNEFGVLGMLPQVDDPAKFNKAWNDLSSTVKGLIQKFDKEGIYAAAADALSTAPGFQDSQAGRLLGQSTGKILNPHMSTIFQGVNIRTHQFSWRLSPRNQDETKAITKIDKMFQYNLHPKMSDNTFSLDYPNQLYIDFFPKSEDFNYKVRKSVITSYVLNNAATGMPAWFGQTNAPTDYELTVALQEVDIVTRNELEL